MFLNFCKNKTPTFNISVELIINLKILNIVYNNIFLIPFYIIINKINLLHLLD